MPGGPPDARRDGTAVIRTFLIADIRGYTRFTQLRGDEAAARLAATFADVAETVVSDAGGRVQELRGDEAMCVFSSPRQAVRAAVALQRQFVAMTIANPDLPFGVGIGIDAGEAVRVKGGYRGGALNLAARLCSRATAGEILASREAVHLARRIDGLTYADRGQVAFKGIDEPTAVVEVVPADRPAASPAFLAAVRPRHAEAVAARARRRRWARALAAGAVAVIAADLTVVAVHAGDLKPLSAIGTDSVGIVDLHQSVLYDRVPVGAGAGALAASSTAVWVANSIDGTVSSINLQHHAVANTLPVGRDPAGVAVGEGAVWVAAANDRAVARIDPRSKTVVGHIAVGNGPTALAAGRGAVWVANSLDGTVSVINPRTDAVTATIAVGGQPAAVAVGADVWVANSGSETVSRIDPTTRQVVATIPVGNDPDALAIDSGEVWVANATDGTVSRIDPSSNSVTATVHVGGEPSALAAAGGVIWVADAVGDRVSRLDVASEQISRVVPLGNAPQAAVVAGGRLWVSARGSAVLHHGGTLHVAVDPDASLRSLDPATGYTNFGWSLETDVYDGLVAFQRVGGPGGTLIVPDLAAALPTISNGGRTYTFQLRRGIRFSDGHVLTASDVLRSFTRSLVLGAPIQYYSSIIGATSCAAPAHQCGPLARGVVADDTGDTVTLHLQRADPELLYKLALPFASVVGPSAPPNHDVGFGGLIGTGPYVFDPKPPAGHIVLRRNPRFRLWSQLARPGGYPDVIDIRTIRGSADARVVAATAAGRDDFIPTVLTGPEIRGLQTRRPTQLHPFPEPITRYLFLNTRVAPFNDPQVRQAVNLAFDRKQAVAAFGGDLFASPTCQVLPPTLLGYTPYCPYTTDPTRSGAWTGPDLARARRLVAASGTQGDLVKVQVERSQNRPEVELERVLGDLGYRVTTRTSDNTPTGPHYFTYNATLAHHAQAGLDAWYADYPAPSNFIQQLLSCQAISRVPGTNIDESEFCDAGIDRRIQAALALQTTDPAAAGSAWAALDHAITDDAPWVPLVNDRGWDLVSARVGDYQHNPEWGALLDQMWVQ
jgi:YVTN family beta-propeller protein